MKNTRERMTWQAAGRKASAPPATPGYGKEDQDHPAHLPDPDAKKYENGDTSSWAEDPHQPPYPQGNPPSTPGYDVEDKDHPAHIDLPRVPKEARALAAAQRKAAKCIRVAELILQNVPGKTAEMVEDQALDLMNLPDSGVEATFGRISGGFLAEDESFDELDELLADDEEDAAPVEESPKTAMEDILLAVKKLSEDVNELKTGKRADQNDPKGPTLAPKPKTEEEARKPEVTAADSDPVIKEFDTYDTSKTGFLMSDEWKGSRAVFAALDTDKDGIIARCDLVKMACGCDETVPMMANELDTEEEALLAEFNLEDVPVTAEEIPAEEPVPTVSCDQMAEEDTLEDITLAEDAQDPMGLADEPEMTEDLALLAEILGGKVAKKAEDEEENDEAETDDEEEPVKEGGKGKKATKKSEDEADDEAKTDDEEKEEEPAKEGGKKAAVRVASRRPQPRKVSAGVKSVGSVPKVHTDEIKELSKLWESSPDVSGAFNG